MAIDVHPGREQVFATNGSLAPQAVAASNLVTTPAVQVYTPSGHLAPTRRLTTAKGRAVDTPFTDSEALGICRQIVGNTFADSMVFSADRYGLANLHADKLTWLHILAVEQLNSSGSLRALQSVMGFVTSTSAPAPAPTQVNFAAIQAIFAAAHQHLKSPGVKIGTVDAAGALDQTVALVLANSRSRHPSAIYVSDGARSGPYGRGIYFGRIDPNGDFHPAGACTQAVTDLLVEFGNDPAGVAARYGKLVGRCCFCSLALSDPQSLAVGYGKVCAGHYGLPWGPNAKVQLPQVVAAAQSGTPIFPAQPAPPAPPAPTGLILGYVNVYLQKRVKGGDEEGGWYYDLGSLLKSIPYGSIGQRDQVVRIEEHNAEQANQGQPAYDDPSCPVLRGVWVEETPGADFPATVPAYS